MLNLILFNARHLIRLKSFYRNMIQGGSRGWNQPLCLMNHVATPLLKNSIFLLFWWVFEYAYPLLLMLWEGHPTMHQAALFFPQSLLTSELHSLLMGLTLRYLISMLLLDYLWSRSNLIWIIVGTTQPTPPPTKYLKCSENQLVFCCWVNCKKTSYTINHVTLTTPKQCY